MFDKITAWCEDGRMEIPDKKKGMALRLARKKLRLLQYEFAELVGCSSATLCEWETSRRIPRGINWRMVMIVLEQRGITFDAEGTPIQVDSPTKDKKRQSKEVTA